MPLGVSVQVDTSGIGVSLSELESRKATYRAVSTGIKIVTRAVKGRAPKRYGYLKSAQGQKAKKGTKGKTGSYAVSGSRTKYRKVRDGKPVVPAFYDHLVIGGTKSHSIRKGSRLARTKRGKTTPEIGQGVGKKHPGARANPFRLRAYQSVRGDVQAAMMLAMRLEVQKILAKANAKTVSKGIKSVRKLLGV